MIRIGRVSGAAEALPQVSTHDAEIRPHLGKPWLNERIAHYYGIAPASDADSADPESAGGFSEAAVSRHTLITGTTGAGKSRLYLLMAEQLLQQGCSMVAVDPKEETLLHLIELARQAGVKAHNVRAFLPRQGDGIPGWNPLAGTNPDEAAEEFADTIWAANERGHQMGEALASALVPITAHGLALPELARLLRSSAYRARILSLPDPPGWEDDMDIAREYFQFDYSDTFAASVTNKFSAVVRNRYLRRVISAERNTVDFDRLWDKDRTEERDEQRLVVVHLDNKSMGEEAMRFLGGSIAWRTYRAADRIGGPKTRPVVLGLDEIGLAEGYLAGALSKILAIGRGKNLRLILSLQYIEQLPPRVQKDLLKLTNARAYLRVDADDAAVIAKTLAPGKSASVPDRIQVDAVKTPKGTEVPPMDHSAFTLHDAHRRPLAVKSPPTWGAFAGMLGASATKAQRQLAVQLLARAGGLTTDRLYIRDVYTGKWSELFGLVAGLRDADWHIDGPEPVRLAVSFPLSHLRELPGGGGDAVARWTDTLATLKDQDAVIEDRTGGRPTKVATHTVPDAAPPARYLNAVLRNGFLAKDADAVYRKRREAMRELSATEQPKSGKSSQPRTVKAKPAEMEVKPDEDGLL